jgi:hypothetical protein
MNKIIFTMRANTAHHVFDYSYATLDYVFRMYTAEQKTQFYAQQEYCEAQGWLDPVPVLDLDDIATVEQAYANPTSCVFVDKNNNSFTFVMTGNDLQTMWDYFVLDNANFKPMRDHYIANPGQGELTATIMYGSIPQAIDVASLYD